MLFQYLFVFFHSWLVRWTTLGHLGVLTLVYRIWFSRPLVVYKHVSTPTVIPCDTVSLNSFNSKIQSTVTQFKKILECNTSHREVYTIRQLIICPWQVWLSYLPKDESLHPMSVLNSKFNHLKLWRFSQTIINVSLP